MFVCSSVNRGQIQIIVLMRSVGFFLRKISPTADAHNKRIIFHFFFQFIDLFSTGLQPSVSVWLGINDREQQGNLSHWDSGDVVNYENWASGHGTFTIHLLLDIAESV